MNIYCDQYSVCNSYMPSQGDEHTTEERARAKGWHIFHGKDHGGKDHNAVLCGKCVDVRRRQLDPAPPVQPGQMEIAEVMVYCPPGS